MKRVMSWYETRACKCRVDANVCNNKLRWNSDKYKCELKEFLGKDRCHDGFISNPSACKFECDELCDVGEYLNYVDWKCRKKLIDKLLERSREDIDGNEII